MSGLADPADDDYLLLVVRRWKTLLLFTILGGVAAGVYAFMAPSWYSARLTVVPSTRSQESAAMLLASKLPGIDASSADSKRIEAVLTSTSVTDEVIAKFDLQKRYGTAFHEQTRQTVWKHCSTSVDKKSGVVALICEDKDPKVAMEMTAYFGEVGNRVFGRVMTSSAREEVRFLEAQVASARKDVDEASLRLREFQERHKVIDLPEQAKAVISAMASIKGELVSKELELSYLSSFASRTESSVLQLRQQIAIMESKLRQLESAAAKATPAAGSASKGEFFPEAMAVPELRFELEQLLRDQKIKETVFALMTQRLEMARVDAARDTPTFSILDHPTLPTFRSRPIRRKVAMTGAAAGGVAGCAWILLPIWWRRRTSTRLAR
jgi:uncharacterized protein involved in exopolysaccharide biosynthesis